MAIDNVARSLASNIEPDQINSDNAATNGQFLSFQNGTFVWSDDQVSYPIVEYYSDLPPASEHMNEIYLVLYSSGIWLINRKEAGLWTNDGITWRRLGNFPEWFKDSNFEIYNNIDNSKAVKFDVSNVSTGVTRTVTFSDKDGTIALISDLPTSLSQLTNDDNYVQDANYVHTDNNFTTVEKSKLTNIEYNAQVNTIETVNNVLPDENKNITLTKSDIGLSNVDNTNDLNKPISTLTQQALDGKENVFTKNTAFNKSFGILVDTVAEGNHLHTDIYEPANTNIQSHISSTSNPHSVTKTQVGLSNVQNVDTTNADNISDGVINVIITKTQETNFESAHTHSQIVTGNPHQVSIDDLTDGTNVARRNTANNYTGNQTITGDLTVNGNIIQSGETYITYAQEVRQKNDLIITRDEAISGLTNGQYTGIQAKLYNGVDDGQLVFGNDGFARVGDVGDLQVLATREDSPIDNGIPSWDANTHKFVTKDGLRWASLILTLPGMLDLSGSGSFGMLSRGISFYNPNKDYKIGFDEVSTTQRYMRYNVGEENSNNGHMFSKGTPGGTLTNLLLIRNDGTLFTYGNVDIPSGSKYKINGVDLSAIDVGAEPSFSKNTAFNKNFGTTAGTVAEGNHSHAGVYEPANDNIQSHISNISNPHSVTKEQLGLGTTDNVTFRDVNCNILKPKTSGAFSLASKGIVFYSNNDSYKIGFDDVGGTRGYIRYNVDSAGSSIHGHMFSGGTAGSQTDYFSILTNGKVNAIRGKIQEYGYDLIPRGVIVEWSGLATAVPSGWVLCDGGTYTAPNGDSVTTPNLSGKFTVSYKVGDTDFGTVGQTGGSKTHTHEVNRYDVKRDTDNAPAVPGVNHYHGYWDNQTDMVISNTNLVPYYVVCKIMKL